LLERLMAESKLTNLKSALTDGYNLQVNFNGDGYGGACYGDSGGPVIYGRYPSNTIVAITGWNNNGNCAGVSYFYRTDRQEVIDWILQTIPQNQVDDMEFVG
jgi:secreted trypsin-like serine protease